MKIIKQNALLIVVFVLSAVAGFFGVRYLRNLSESSTDYKPVVETVPVSVAEPVVGPSVDSVAGVVPEPLYVYDSTAIMRSFQPEMIFSENFHSTYRDSSFTGSYQLVYPIRYPLDSLVDSEFDRLLLSLIFGENAPKKVNRKSIQASLDKMMKGNVNHTHKWWKESRATYGRRWREEVCSCSGYFYFMPIAETSDWISFQQVSDYRCGGNGGPSERYYTVIKDRAPYVIDTTVLSPGRDPYVMDTTAFVPNFREKMIEMITDNVMFNRYARFPDNNVEREMVRQATAEQFKGNFQPVLTVSGVRFLFSTWALPHTSHADGRIPVIVPYNMIQEIFTEKFKKDIGL
ncbi:MAG: hypothetical protein MJY87_06400 [Fibrobacter sp.]|nr:hypothetical protein [Fibrobacter sp.]